MRPQILKAGVSTGHAPQLDQGQPNTDRFPRAGGHRTGWHAVKTKPSSQQGKGAHWGEGTGRPRPRLSVPANGARRQKIFVQEVIQVKTCSKCGEVKAAGEFYVDKGHRDRLSSACRLCMRAQAVAWQRANPQKAREMKARYAAKRRTGRGKPRARPPRPTPAAAARNTPRRDHLAETTEQQLADLIDQFNKAWVRPEKWNEGELDEASVRLRDIWARERDRWTVNLLDLVRTWLLWPQDGPDATDGEALPSGRRTSPGSRTTWFWRRRSWRGVYSRDWTALAMEMVKILDRRGYTVG